MLNVNRIALVIPLILLALCAFGGCQGSRVDTISQEPGASLGSDPAQQPGFDTFLPSPRAMLERQELEKAASAFPESYIRYGDSYEATLPENNVLPGPHNSVEFMPSWSDATGKTPADLAYCIYGYSIPSYSLGAELRYGWSMAPPEIGTVWFGLSNWDSDRWDWIPATESGISYFSSADPYFSESDEMYVVVVCASDDISVMRHLRIGGMPPADVVLVSTPRYSRPPVTVGGDATGSTVPVGTVESYEWDWDNDGTFEDDSGSTPTSSSSYDAVGDHSFSVRVTSSYGEQATGSDTFTVVEPWTHSWGTDLYQDIGEVATDGSEFCYSAGSTMRSAGHRDALLLKHSLGGELVWAAAWGGEEHDSLADVKFSHDGIFTVGQSDSYGVGDYDVLLQRWDEDGNIVWSSVWGTAGIDRGAALALTDSAVYVAGASEAMGDMDVILLKYDFDGAFLWARTWGCPGYDAGTDIASTYQPIPDKYSLYVTGATSPSVYQYVLYLEFEEDASFNTERVWRSDTQDHQFGGAITVYSFITNKHIYIAGSIGDADQREALLVKAGTGTGNLARCWSSSTECVAYDVLRSADNLYIAGRGWELGISSGGFVAGFSLSGSLQNSAYWADTDDNTGITALHVFPGSGLLVGGNCRAADLGSWSGTSSTVTNPGGTWSDYCGTISVPMGSTGSPAVSAVKVTSGAVDTGGGGSDTLLSVVQFP
jgi:hypothetical protein